MTKIREAIIARNYTGVAFVSYRILISLRDTYIVSRNEEMQQVKTGVAIKNPKTLKDGIDSFLNLFKPTQIQYLKDESGYDDFVNRVIPAKNNLRLGSLNTYAELDEVKRIIEKNEALMGI
jgi:hypothetical protein